MLNRTTIAAAMVAAALSLTAAAAQDDPRYPDWSGQWRKAPDGGPPRYDPSKPDGAGQQAPIKEEYRRIHEASMADQARGGQGLYVMSVKCIPMGMPFQMSIVFPFEFVITSKTTYVLFEIMTSQPRRIYTDGRDWPKDPDPTFTGYSIGKWIDEDGTAASTCRQISPATLTSALAGSSSCWAASVPSGSASTIRPRPPDRTPCRW
jgi:hypothetical protein